MHTARYFCSIPAKKLKLKLKNEFHLSVIFRNLGNCSNPGMLVADRPDYSYSLGIQANGSTSKAFHSLFSVVRD